MNEFEKIMLLASIIAMYTVGAEDNIPDMQKDAANDFCDLIELNETEFNELGLTFKR